MKKLLIGAGILSLAFTACNDVNSSKGKESATTATDTTADKKKQAHRLPCQKVIR